MVNCFRWQVLNQACFRPTLNLKKTINWRHSTVSDAETNFAHTSYINVMHHQHYVTSDRKNNSFSCAASSVPWSVLISTIWKKVVQKHSCQNHRLKKVPSCKLSAYSITVRQASNGWYSSSQCFNSTSDKSPVAIHFSLITQPLLIYRHFTLQSVYCFYLSQHAL